MQEFNEEAAETSAAAEAVAKSRGKYAKKRFRLFSGKKKMKKESEPEHTEPKSEGTPDQNTSGGHWAKWFKSSGMFLLICVYEELCLHMCVFKSVDSRIVYPILFGVFVALLMALICTALPRIPGRALTIILSFGIVIYTEVQLVYHSIFGNFMPLNQVSMGEGVVTNFGNQILYGIGHSIVSILLLAIPIFFLIIMMILGKSPRRRVTFRQTLTSLGLMLVTLIAITALMLSGKDETFSVYEIFTNVNTSTDLSYKNIGIFATTEQELRYMLLGVSQENQSLGDSSLGRSASTSSYSSKQYNVLDIDFDALAESTDDEMLKALDEYFATVTPSRKNDYTGLLEGYNLITICAESFSPYLIDEERTPALYKMSHTGIIFNNYYGTYNSVTTNGEYTMNMGLYPDLSRTKTQSSFDVSASNYVPFCLGNELLGEGYQTWAYHNYIGDFYNRNLTHPNMGYTFKAADSGLDITVDWPSSDLEMMEASVDDYLEGKSSAPFCAYYMTFSGHYQYTWDNAMSAKNRDAVADLDYSDTVKAYIACNLELEYAMEYLLDRLEEAGVADKTVIVLTNDHYPYGLTEEEYNELAGTEVDTTYEKYHNSFICYVPGLRENINVDSYCSTADILPTLLNLFGVDYDSRLLAGTDIFSSSPHIAVLSDESFLTSGFRFDASTEEVTPTIEGQEIDQDTVDNYRLYVSNKFIMSTDILNSNYYGHVFGVENNDSELEDTIVFTDITNIFNQASVLYMYRNGYVDSESDTTFGGKHAATIGEFCDVLYRIAERPEYTAVDLPSAYNRDEEFNEDNQYYDAVEWAFAAGILQTSDTDYDIDIQWDDDVDFRTAAVLIKRFANYMGISTNVDAATVSLYQDEYPKLNQESIEAMLWVDSQDITTKSVELSELFSGWSDRISRYQMTSFLFYFCTYELNLDN